MSDIESDTEMSVQSEKQKKPISEKKKQALEKARQAREVKKKMREALEEEREKELMKEFEEFKKERLKDATRAVPSDKMTRPEVSLEKEGVKVSKKHDSDSALPKNVEPKRIMAPTRRRKFADFLYK
jgi:hypothetical protein